MTPGPNGKSLGVSFEGIRRRLRALVVDQDRPGSSGCLRIMALKLSKNEGYVCAALLNGLRLHEALNAQVRLIGLLAHPLHFCDRYVITLAGSCSRVGEVADSAQDYDGGDPDSKMLLGNIHCDPEFLGIPCCI